MKNTIIVQKNMKSLLTAKFCDNYLLDVQALILMFAGKEIITSKIEIRSSKIKITVKAGLCQSYPFLFTSAAGCVFY